MIDANTFVFVLALVASVSGAAWWITSLMRAAAKESLQSTSQSNFETLSRRIDELQKQSPAKLAAEVAELSEAVAKLAESQRRFQGRVWQRVGANDRESGVQSAVDPDLQAMLALQSAPSAQPR